MTRPSALLSAARGIGDILRITPLVRVCGKLGYDVDVLLAPDYPDAAALIEGAPGVRRLFRAGSPWRREPMVRPRGLDEQYDVAVFTCWSQPLRAFVRASRALMFEQTRWLREGDIASVASVARQLGWTRPLPPPVAVASSRRFDLEAGTIALHPGCKPDWPWKKWHGFDELAARFPHVVVIGSPDDRSNAGTYFGRPFAWPPHVRDFTGGLSLPDTAALIAQSAALVANDSGLMHLGVALGVPTFGIFGITSPLREAIDAPNMHVVTKGLPCEPACRRASWGRRDCEYHLKCLRTLSVDEVCAHIRTAGTVWPLTAIETVIESPEATCAT